MKKYLKKFKSKSNVLEPRLSDLTNSDSKSIKFDYFLDVIQQPHDSKIFTVFWPLILLWSEKIFFVIFGSTVLGKFKKLTWFLREITQNSREFFITPIVIFTWTNVKSRHLACGGNMVYRDFFMQLGWGDSDYILTVYSEKILRFSIFKDHLYTYEGHVQLSFRVKIKGKGKFSLIFYQVWMVFLINCQIKHNKTKNCGDLVQPVQLFESTKFRDYWPTLTCYIFWLMHVIGLIYIPFCAT